MAVTLENLSDLPQRLIFYPLPKEVSVELDLIPIQLLPREKFTTNIVYRSGKVLDTKKDESFLNCKIVTGSISTRDIRIPYSCEIKRCPVEFSSLKMDFPVLQTDERHSATLRVKNTTYKEIIFEFFLPYEEVCGLHITPMVQKIAPSESVEISIEYSSFFKRLGAFTLMQLKERYENDPHYSFENKMRLKRA